MDEKTLLAFIAKAHRNTYAAPTEVRKQHRCDTPILPGHKDYAFEEGDLSYHDSYAGSSWAPGREVVFHKGNPIWCMSYQGKDSPDTDEFFLDEEVFPFLKKALTNFDDSMPFRGPSRFTSPSKFNEGEFEYTFEMEGDYRYFKGRERITFRGEEVFFQDVMGSLIK